MDDWKIIIGASTVTIIALYFSDRYINGNNNNNNNSEQSDKQRLEAAMSSNNNNNNASTTGGFFRSRLNSLITPQTITTYQCKQDIRNFIFNNNNMQQVAKIFKRHQLSALQKQLCGNNIPDEISVTSPSLNQTSSRPKSPSISGNNNNNSGSLTSPNNNDNDRLGHLGSSISSFFSNVSTHLPPSIQTAVTGQQTLDDSYTGVVLEVLAGLHKIPISQYNLFFAEMDKIFQILPNCDQVFSQFKAQYPGTPISVLELIENDNENNDVTLTTTQQKEEERKEEEQQQQEEDNNTTKKDKTDDLTITTNDNDLIQSDTSKILLITSLEQYFSQFNTTGTTIKQQQQTPPSPRSTTSYSNLSTTATTSPQQSATIAELSLSAHDTNNGNNDDMANNLYHIERQEDFVVNTIHKLYLLTMKLDNHPDMKLQAFYDLYDVKNNSTNNNNNSSSSFAVSGFANDTSKNSNNQSEEVLAAIDNDYVFIQSDDEDNNNNNNHTVENNNNNDNNNNQQPPSLSKLSITYPLIHDTITTLHTITTLSILLENTMRIKVNHDDEFHEALLKILWEFAPLTITKKTTATSTPTPTVNTNPTTNNNNDENKKEKNENDDGATTKVLIDQQTDTKPAYKQKDGKLWGYLGFQGQDPVTDFRGVGLLGLLMLALYCILYPDEYFLHVKAHQEQGIKIYGLAITSINIVAKLVQMTKDHELDALYFEYGADFFTFVKIHRYVLTILSAEWAKRQNSSNITMQMAHPANQTSTPSTSRPSFLSSSTSSPSTAQQPPSFRNVGLTIMDFPIVFKDVITIFKKQIFHDEVRLE